MRNLTPVDDVLRAAGIMTLGQDPPLDALEEALGCLKELLADISPLRRAVIREGAIKALASAGVRAPAQLVDAALAGDGQPLQDDKAEKWRTYGPPIVDIVRTPEGIRYLVARPGKGIGLEEALQGREPWPPAGLPWPVIPDAGHVLFALDDEAEAPLEELRELISQRVVLPDPAGTWASLLSAWILGTYVLDRLPYFPLILLEGPPERGKSRLAKALTWLAFRGLLIVSTSAAMLVRDRAWHRVTAAIDVEDLPGVIKRGDYLGDLLLASYEKDGQVRRCVRPDAEPPNQADSLPAYGACIAISNRPLPDDSPLSSRCIRVPLPEAGGRSVPDALFPEEALSLRARVVAWAARFTADDVELPKVDVPFRGRARDLALPLLRILALVAPGEVGGVTRLLGQVDADRRGEANRSREGRVSIALWRARSLVQAGRLSIKELAEVVNEGLEEEDPDRLSVQQVGVARRALGLRGGKGGTPPRAYLLWPGDDAAQALHDRYSQPTPGPLEGLAGSEGSSGDTGKMSDTHTRKIGRVGTDERSPATAIPSNASDASGPSETTAEERGGTDPPSSFDLWLGGPTEPDHPGPAEPRPGLDI